MDATANVSPRSGEQGLVLHRNCKENTKIRGDILRQIIKDTGKDSQITNIKDLRSGSPGKRVITSNVIVEFSSRSVRESVLDKLVKKLLQ